MLISTDFSGDVTSATWTPLSCNLAGSNNTNYDWVDSGPIDLSAFSGTGHIAFRYEGTGASNTTTYQLDDIQVVE